MKPTLLFFAFAVQLLGQATMISTTLARDLGTDDGVIYLTSNAGVVAATSTRAASILLVDREAIGVTSVGSQISVSRGILGTLAVSHASGATVWIGAPGLYAQTDPSGSCTADHLRVLPRVVIVTGRVWDCTGGLWTMRGGGANPGGSDGDYQVKSGTSLAGKTPNAANGPLVLGADGSASIDTTVLPGTAIATTASTTVNLIAGNNGQQIAFTAATDVTLNITSAVAVKGFSILIIQRGLGSVVPTASGGGITIRQRQSYTTTAGQYAMATLSCDIAGDCILGGDLQ